VFYVIYFFHVFVYFFKQRRTATSVFIYKNSKRVVIYAQIEFLVKFS